MRVKVYPSNHESLQKNKHKAQLKCFGIQWIEEDIFSLGACEGDIRVVGKFIHNGGGGLISGRGYRAKAECGKGQSTHMEMCEVGGSKMAQKSGSYKAGLLNFSQLEVFPSMKSEHQFF